MISLSSIFWLMVLFFALIGLLRGWTKEVIATSGLVLSLFTLANFGALIVARISDTTASPDPNAVSRQQFYLMCAIHLTIAFFSYQGPALAGTAFNDRLRVRDSLQDKVLGALIGGVNGYLIVGTIWSFLEYIPGAEGFERLPAGQQYPFEAATIIRPTMETAAYQLAESLPLPLLEPYLAILVVIVFLFVIIVMI